MRLPTGVEVKTKEEQSSSMGKLVRWELTRWGRAIASGIEKNERKAKDAAWEKLREVFEAGEAGGYARQKARQQIKYLLETRPYLMGGIFELLLTKNSTTEVVAEAAETEKRWWENEPKQFRKPLPTHHRSLAPEAAAERVIDALEKLGYIYHDEGVRLADKNKIKRYAIKLFGEVFANA